MGSFRDQGKGLYLFGFQGQANLESGLICSINSAYNKTFESFTHSEKIAAFELKK